MERRAVVGGTACARSHDCRRHAASGIACDLLCHTSAPVGYLEIRTIEIGIVRAGEWGGGDIDGELSVWASPGGWEGKTAQENAWQLVHRSERRDAASMCMYGRAHSWKATVTIELDPPVRVLRGECTGLYVFHASVMCSLAIRGPRPRTDHIQTCPLWPHCTPECAWKPAENIYMDGLLSVKPGSAAPLVLGPNALHPSHVFRFLRHQLSPNRELDATLTYVPRWLKWSPERNYRFPHTFRRAVETFRVHHGTSSQGLPLWAVRCVLEMCDPDWFCQPALDDES